MDENGDRRWATISDHVQTLDHTQVSQENQHTLILKVDGEQLDDLISYNQPMEHLDDTITTGPTADGLYQFKSIQDHKGPYSPSDPEYLGSSYTYLMDGKLGRSLGNP